jgi:ABC-2 type transport system permease protein
VRPPGDRGAWRLVARRDFWVRLRDKGFLISTVITLAVFTVFILIGAYGGGGGLTFDLGLVGSASRTLGPLVVRAGPSEEATIRTRDVDDVRRAEEALRDGAIDAALVDGERLVVRSDLPDPLERAVQVAIVAARIRSAMEGAGVSAEQVGRILAPTPVAVRSLEPVDPNRHTNSTVAFVAVLLLYGQLFGYGVWVATGVIEEKSSRVVEILLSTIRARQLLGGKIAGIGALGLLQLMFVSAYGIVLATATGALDVPASAVGTALLALFWFAMAFVFYASLFAVAGALVSRMEELQNAIVPLNLVILASLFSSLQAVHDPGGGVARVASLLPVSSALAMPVRITLGAASGWEVVGSAAILLASTALLIPLAGRVYSGAVLRVGGRVKLRDAWRSAG